MSEPSITGYFMQKSGEGFVLLDDQGMIPDDPASPCGVVWRNMRHIGKCEPLIGGEKFLFLKAEERKEDQEIHFHYTNQEFTDRAGNEMEGGKLMIVRSLTMADGRVHERMEIENISEAPVDTAITLLVEAGFDDIFDIRNRNFLETPPESRHRRGILDEPILQQWVYSQNYTWKNGLGENTAEWRFSQAPDEQAPGRLSFNISIAPGERKQFYSSYGPLASDVCMEGTQESEQTYIAARDKAHAESQKLVRDGTGVISINASLNRMLDQSMRDLSVLCADLATGLYPMAGLPWFSTPFGRDGIITALLLLPIFPQVARGVLAYLAENQATVFNRYQQAEPGKIIHEVRTGSEACALGEFPYKAYHGGVDTTPLFAILADRYLERTGDTAFIESIWPKVKKAIGWVTENMDKPEHRGFVRYSYDRKGLTQQGWKDSSDSILHADSPGELPQDPIALCEVQAYAYGALQAGEQLGVLFNDSELAADSKARADDLYRRFNEQFWLPDLGTYALALDGNDKPCAVRSSNAGHALLTGIVPADRAPTLVQTLMHPDSYSGFGIRTLAEGPGYNPLSYHRGSVWPHDTAVIAVGMKRYGFKEETAELLRGFMAMGEDNPRLPELFSGAPRIPGQPKEPYPSACSPQAWAAAATLGVVAACLRLEFDLAAGTVTAPKAFLPPEAEGILIQNIPVGASRCNLDIRAPA
jgi:glycogen debranching enzyme